MTYTPEQLAAALAWAKNPGVNGIRSGMPQVLEAAYRAKCAEIAALVEREARYREALKFVNLPYNGRLGATWEIGGGSQVARKIKEVLALPAHISSSVFMEREPCAECQADPELYEFRPCDHPRPMVLYCPAGHQHIDEGEWATRPHKTHRCQHFEERVVYGTGAVYKARCGLEWRPANLPTVGVKSLPKPAKNARCISCRKRVGVLLGRCLACRAGG